MKAFEQVHETNVRDQVKTDDVQLDSHMAKVQQVPFSKSGKFKRRLE